MRRLSKFDQYLDAVYPSEDGEDEEKEQALLIKIKLSDQNLGTDIDNDFMYPLEERLRAAMESCPSGCWTGHETGEGYTTIFFYGKDADKIHQAIWPELKKTKFPKKSYLIKYLGSENEKEVIDLNALIN